jgi:tol-pal system protein YbgF
MRRLILAGLAGLALGLPPPGGGGAARAQDAQTLADIRADIAALLARVQALRSELSATGQGGGAEVGGSVLDRVAAMEAELVRLTAATEALENRINRIVADGTSRLGDLEFRLCEIEPGCDIAALGRTAPLGGEAAAPAAADPAPDPAEGGGGPQLAVGEQADYDRALAAYEAGDWAGAAGLFQTFTETYSGGPLYGQAHYWRGEALAQQGDTAGAARAFLESFSAAPDGPRAADALFRLGQSLGALGQVQEACLTLAEVPFRFGASPRAAEAEAERRRLACP